MLPIPIIPIGSWMDFSFTLTKEAKLSWCHKQIHMIHYEHTSWRKSWGSVLSALCRLSARGLCIWIATSCSHSPSIQQTHTLLHHYSHRLTSCRTTSTRGQSALYGQLPARCLCRSGAIFCLGSPAVADIFFNNLYLCLISNTWRSDYASVKIVTVPFEDYLTLKGNIYESVKFEYMQISNHFLSLLTHWDIPAHTFHFV